MYLLIYLPQFEQNINLRHLGHKYIMSDKIPVNYFPMKGGGNLETYAPRTLYGISSNL